MNANKPLIMIGIPTCSRPLMLSKCLESISQIQCPDNVIVHVIVGDNDKDKSAYAVVQKFMDTMPFAMEYSLCIERGLSNIRNHLLKQAIILNADYLACIDDDCLASERWLVNLYDAVCEHQADAVGYGEHVTKNPRLSTESIIMSAKIYRDLALRYNLTFNFYGAEDDDFAKRAINAGAVFYSDPRIKIYPQASAHRDGWWLYICHHYARFTASAYVNRTQHGRPVGYFIFDIFFYFLKGIMLLPAALFSVSYKKRCFKSLIRCVAFSRSLFGASKYQPYKKIDGN